MQKQPPSSFCARAAIAAALALGSTAAFAQDVAPAPDVPTVAPPAPVAGPVAPQVVTQANPVVQPVPASPEPAAAPPPAAPARTAARAQPAARPAARTAPAAVAVPLAATPIVGPPPAPVAQAPLAQPAPVVPAPIAAAEPRLADDGLTGAEAGMLVLLAAAGLAGAGLLVARSRRKRNDEVIEDYASSAAVLDPAPAPAFVREPALERFAQPVSQPATPTPVMAVPAGDAHKALLERMVAADPDDENPFVSRKRRVRRARMILAQREQSAVAPEPFDWRTYRPAVTNPRVREDVPEPSTV